MKNKILKHVILFILTFSVTFFSVACLPLLSETEKPSHSHNYSNEYISDNENHWNECSCGDKNGVELHKFVEGVCKCGYEDEGYVPDHTMAPDKWLTVFMGLSLTNVTLKGYVMQQASDLESKLFTTIKIDGNKSSEESFYENGRGYHDVYEFSKIDLSGQKLYTKYLKNYVGYLETEWNVKENYPFAYSAEILLKILPFGDKFSEFTYNQETKCYEAFDLICESDVYGVLEYDTVNLIYENGMLVDIDAVLKTPFSIVQGARKNTEYHFSFSDYGKTLVSIPTENVHIHEYNIINFNETQHWTECSCGSNASFELHTLENNVCECGYKVEQEYTDGVEFALINNDSAYAVVGYHGDSAEVIIPSIYCGKPVTNIADDAFGNCQNIRSIFIPDSVSVIGMRAFLDCTSLIEIEIPDTVLLIGLGAFCRCESLESVSFGENSQLIGFGENTFDGCINLSAIEIPQNVIIICSETFARCTSLDNVIFNNPEGWFVKNEQITITDLTNPKTAAEYLTDTYCNYDWERES